MANYIVCLFLQRLILPLILVASFLFRPVLLALPYLVFLFALPFVPVATIKNMRGGRTGVYFYCLMAVSCLMVVLQVAFHITVASVPDLPAMLQDCQFLEYLFRHLGFVYLRGLSWQQMVLWIYPEVLMTIASIIIFVALQNLVIGHIPLARDGEEATPLSERSDYDTGLGPEKLVVCVSIGKVLSIITLLFAAVFHPSAINGIYFLIFLGAATWWSCAKELERGFGVVLRCTLVVFALHITSFMVYQTPWPQEFLDSNSTVARVLGFTPLIYSKCGNETHNITNIVNTTSAPVGDSNETIFTSFEVPETIEVQNDLRVIQFSEYNADYYLNPLCLILCYYTIAITSSLLLGPKENVNRADDTEIEQPTERTPLMRGGTRKIRDMGTLTPGTAANEGPSGDIPMEEMDEERASFFEQLAAVTSSMAAFIYQNSYIFTNVVMMTWSIVYHSWFGFVFLIWSNLIWIIPNQRMNMLRSSPFLVIYAEVLLLINYVYGMDLTDEELPSKVPTKGISLSQIGIIKYREYPCGPLILKSLFTAMFWITLRQMIQEKKAHRQTSALADMVAPLQVTVSPAASALTPKPEPKTSAFVAKMGNVINAFLVKGWIWIVAITLFIFGISGQRMTGFRIIYMALFLFFVITFQLSLTIWRKILYGFWLVVIVYSMAILVLVYTYQFDKFNTYWDMYLSISDTLQKDIGLEKYETKQLFLHLVSPTMIVIITVIQLHYCHKKFLEISEIPQRPEGDQSIIDDTSSIYGAEERNVDELNREMASDLNLVDRLKKRKFSKKDVTKTLGHLWKKLQHASEYVWVFLEIHFLKIIMIAAFYLAIDHVRFLHILFASVATLGVGCRSRTQVLATKIASLFCSILLILMMIYQIEYIDANSYAYNCDPNATIFSNNSNAEARTVLNNTAVWFGFVKADTGHPLLLLIRPYLVYIVLVTVHAVVTLRQTIRRIRLGQPVQTAKLLFPNIVRRHADKDLPHFLKYMMNYGFYKFGIEMCLVTLTFVIGKRMDIYALMYAFWLCAVFALTRDKLAKIWNLLKWFLTVAIIGQYLTFVGLPPRLCIDYPWATTFFDNFRIWALLPDNTFEFRARANILFTDFLLLLFVCRQLIVFRIENRYRDNPNEFSGGSNQSVLKDLNDLGQVPFVNPTPDFIEKVRNWLDIMKRAFFLVFFWLTLAIVFLAGTNRVNLFSIGYLIGSFAFLWQGTDFYLRPIRVMLKWWNVLIGYTVFVISLKALLQIAGCLFLKSLKTHYCWLVQLLGISCLCFPQAPSPDDQSTCNMQMEDVGLLWDGVCFAFLIVQRRIFSSHYFCHIINETKASTILASRGGELIEELRSKEMKLEQEHEIEVLEKLKAKMDRIKATQQKLLESAKEPAHHAKAIRSGDYYMFDALEDEYKLEVEPPKDELTEEEKKTSTGRRLSRKLTLGQQEASTSQAADQTEAGVSTQPSTSKEDPTSEEEEMSRLIEEEKTRKVRLQFSGLNLILKFINSILVSLTIRLHRVSRNYRFVMRVLAKEKKALKSKEGFGMGLRTGTSMVWTPQTTSKNSRYQGLGAAIAMIAKKDTQAPPTQERKGSFVPEIRVMAPSLERGLDDDPDQTEMPSVLDDDYSVDESLRLKKLEIGDDEEDFASKDHSILVELLIACWYAVLSHTDFICYFFVFLNQINSASILSLPLPVLVLVWGTLTFPRPSKTFWITLIAYTQIVVLLKAVSQFDSLWWNQVAVVDADPFAPARIIGIERKKGYATYDLILLLVVFCHRFILKSLGLWKSEFTDDSIPEGVYKTEVVEKGRGGNPDEQKEFIVKQDDVQLKLKKVDSQANLEDDAVVVTKTVEEPSNYCPGILKLTFDKYLSSAKAFYRQLVDRRSRKTADVYTFIFMCDFVNFFVILFGFSSFGPGGDASVLSYFEENKVPVMFLFMLIIQFSLIVIDRALYLRKNMIGKIIFQFFLIVGLHVWMFFVLPATSERRFNATNPPVIYYLIKCCHLLFSAYQIRCGYPARILGNFLTKGYSLLNSIGFKVFMNIPFLFELRTLMDWVWTDTSFSVFDWLKMEDIFANVYQLKCARVFEDDLPVPRGQKRKPLVKYMMGGLMVLSLIILIWFPLALFAFSSAVGEPNIPFDVTVSLRIGPYEPVYTMSAQDSNIFGLSEGEWNNFMSPYLKEKSALTFLRNYDGVDTAAVVLGANSTTIWNISPPDKERLYLDVIQNKTLTCRFRYTVSRKTHSKEVPGQLSEEQSHVIKNEDPIRAELSKMLNSTSFEPVTLPLLFPKFIKVRTTSMKPAYQLTSGPEDDDDERNYRNVSIRLYSGNAGNATNSSTLWWEMKEKCDDKFYKNYINKLPYSDCNQLVMYLFNDKIFPQGISSVAAGGIVGLYFVFVLTAFWKIRNFATGQMSKIMFEDLPNVDRILQLCLDIYLVREAHEFGLEEDLFAKLIFLYRSPETLIKWTRPRDDEDEEPHPHQD